MIKEENDLKEKLQLEVTKIKEKLENFWSLSNNEIKISEKINKGIKKMENEEKSMLKSLSYISKINKNQKEMKKLSSELMKSIKFLYDEDKNIIKFDEFYFNGMPIPKDIVVNNLSYDSLELIWKIDNLNILNINTKEIGFKVEIKEENNKFNVDEYVRYQKYQSIIFISISGKLVKLIRFMKGITLVF